MTGELVKELDLVPYRCQTLVAWAWSLGQQRELGSVCRVFSSCVFQSVDRKAAIPFYFCNPLLLRNHSKQTFQEKVALVVFSEIFLSPCSELIPDLRMLLGGKPHPPASSRLNMGQCLRFDPVLPAPTSILFARPLRPD